MMFSCHVDLPVEWKHITRTERINNEVFDWLKEHVGKGIESFFIPNSKRDEIMWQSVRITVDVYTRFTRVFFRNQGDAMFFKLVWL